MRTGRIEIVLVEDSADDAELAMRALKKNGINNPLIHLKDGEEALDFIFCKGAYADRNFQEMPRLILLDLKMPKVDGLEVLRQLKADARTRVIPVVLLTASGEEKDIVRSYQLGVNSYIVKPIEFESLVRTVSDMGAYWLVLNQSPY